MSFMSTLSSPKPSSSSSSSSPNRLRNLAVVGFVLAALAVVIYHPLPDDFEQPWKYRFIKFNVELANIYGNVLEYMGIVHRVNITRFFYHFSYGIVNARDHADNISIADDMVGTVPIRVFRPAASSLASGDDEVTQRRLRPRPTIIFYHGGGYIVGSADTFEPMAYLMAKHTGYTVMYVEYRLIPEHAFPAAYTDSLETTIALVQSSAAKYHIDADNLVLMGDSAGGNLATAIGQQLIERRIARPRLQLLIYPILQFFDFTLPSYQLYLPTSVLGSINHDTFKMFIGYFTGQAADAEPDASDDDLDAIFRNGHTTAEHKETFGRLVDRRLLPAANLNQVAHLESTLQHANDTEKRFERISRILLNSKASPLLVDDHYLAANTPGDTILVTVEMDVLRDDGFIYAERLRRVGKRVQHVHYAKLFHGIFGLAAGPFKFDKAAELIERTAKLVKKTLDDH